MMPSTNLSILKRNNVHLFGQGEQVLLFAHGFGCDQNMWRFITPAFEGDYRIVLFDYVGSGKSDLSAYDPERYRSLEGYAQDILDICDALDLRHVILVGHSVSSMIGVLAAKQRPELFDHLILVGPSPSYLNDGSYVGGFERGDIAHLLDLMDHNYIGWANQLAPVIMKNTDRAELSAELEASFCSTDPTIARRFAEATFYADNREDLKDVATPTLVIQCADDALAPVSVGEFVHQQMPNSTLTVLNVSGHCPHMSHPKETVQAIKAYLQATYA
jgi:sigma-B regulation protein RsbQ